MNGDSQAMELERPSADSSKQPSAEEANSMHACCEVCEQGGHKKEDCPLVLAAQESDTRPEAEEADWQVVAGKASDAQAKSKTSKAGKGARRGKGKKDKKGIKEQGKEEKTGNAKMVITVHRDASSGRVPVKRPLGSRDGSSSSQPQSTPAVFASSLTGMSLSTPQ